MFLACIHPAIFPLPGKAGAIMTIGKRPRSEIWVVLSPLVQKIDKRQPGFSGGYLMSNKLRSDASPSIEPGDWQEHNVSGEFPPSLLDQSDPCDWKREIDRQQYCVHSRIGYA